MAKEEYRAEREARRRGQVTREDGGGRGASPPRGWRFPGAGGSLGLGGSKVGREPANEGWEPGWAG